MARFWTCGKCGSRWPRTTQRCPTLGCGRKRPAARKPAHMAALDMPYEWWVERFGSACNICGREASGVRKMDRDHDHKTGKPRGLLCHLCNRRLGNLTREWLQGADAYLARSE